jgi:monofunctional glycosyltransferase
MSPSDPPRIAPTLQPEGLVAPRRLKAVVERARRPGSWLGRMFWLLLVLFLLPPLTVLALRWLPPPTTAFMLQSPARVDYRWVPADKIAHVLRKAAVAAEDQKFWDHHGFDLEAIEKAYASNRKSRQRRGGSTISQQVAKNLFLWPGGGYFRKGIEATFTVLIEAMWSKERILEVYLNIAEFGTGIYGAEAAAQRHFRKSAAALTPREAALLAAVLPSPRRWRVQPAGPYVSRRADWILGQMGYRSAATPAEEPEEPPLLLDADPQESLDGPAGDLPAAEAETLAPDAGPLPEESGAEPAPGADASGNADGAVPGDPTAEAVPQDGAGPET